MSKRDFIRHSGAALLAVSAGVPLMSQARAVAVPPTMDAGGALGSGLASWRALQGEVLEAHTALGRPVALTLTEVLVKAAPLLSQAKPGMSQFTVRLQGPRALPLQAGLHVLKHAKAGELALYLEPVSNGSRRTYDAHFSLVG
jgi:hypothetical protein